MKTNINEKITRLMARSKDKTLSRSERQQAMQELTWEKYRADSRPSMSLKKFKLLDGFVFVADTIIFSYMGLIDKRHDVSFSAGDAVMVIVTILLIAAVIGYLFLHSKYKIEPADELAERDLAKGSRIAFSVIAIALVVIGLIVSWTDPTGVLTLENKKLFSILCSIIFLHGAITNFAFVMLEGKEETEEE